jgi:hypothetical protein
MRKPLLAVTGLLLVAAAVWWFFLRDASRSSPSAAATTGGTPAEHGRAPRGGAGERGGDRDGPMAVLVDDDPVGTLRLEGQVIDAQERPVGGVTVALSANPPRTVTSEPDGSFAFDALVARPYTLTARGQGGVAGPLTAKLTESSEPVVLQLRAGATVVVEVEDGSGEAVDGATVELRATDTLRQATASGAATFTPVVPGGYQLAAWADGRATTLAWINVGPGETREKLRLVPGAPVSGRVVDDSGAAIGGARVTFQGASDWSQQASERHDGVDTAKDGTFRFAALPAGSFRFAATHPDRARASSPLVTLDGRTEQRDIVITLGAGATVRGRVVDAEQRPVPSARVRVGIASRRGMIWEAPRQVYTDARGAFELRGLARRELAAVAMHEIGSSQLVEVDTSAGDVDGITLVIDVTGTIAGMVVDPQGNPLEGVQVSAGPNFRDPGAMTDFTQFRLRGMPQELTDSGGRFTLAGLAPGSYMVNAARGQSLTRGRRGATEGTVAETGTQNLKIVLQPEGGVRGKIAFADGTAPPLFTLQVGFAQQSFSGGRGEFELDALPPRSYELSVRGPTFQARALDIVVEPGKVADVGTITVVKGRHLAGVVLADGKPVPGASVFAGRQLFGNGTSNTANFGPMGQGTKQATADDAGRFSLSGFSTGDLAIVAEHPELGRSKAMRVPTELPGQQELVLELQRFGAVRGVLRAGGKPAEGIGVSCQSTTTPGAIYVVSSGPDGVYRFDRLAPDTYKISATLGMPMMGMKFYSKEIVVPPGKEVSIDLAVEPGSVTLEITATPKTGKLGVASVFLSSGIVAARTASDLGLAMAASGPSASQWVIIRGGEPARFTEVAPGTYSACVMPFPAEVQGMAAMSYADRHSDALPAYCQTVKVGPAPETQAVAVPVELPAYVPDDAGGTGGTGSGSQAR